VSVFSLKSQCVLVLFYFVEEVVLEMPWYLSGFRCSMCCAYLFFAAKMGGWIQAAEDSYRRSLTWKPVVATIFEHKIVMKRGGSSYVQYRFNVDGQQYEGDRFRSGGIHKEEMVPNPMLLGAGTELVVYYNPANPAENAIKIQNDRPSELLFVVGILTALTISYRAVRCETIFPNMFYRFLGGNRRVGASGLKQQRTHNKTKMKYGNF
jgi:hypothetical protein